MMNGNTVTKEFNIYAKDVTCIKCSLCYDCSSPSNRTFCQEFSMEVKPLNVADNMYKAKNCIFFMPDGLPRSIVKSQDRERWYEKDSMG